MRNYLKTRFMFVFSSALNAHRWKSVCTQLCMKTTLMRNFNRIISSYFFLRLLLLIIQKTTFLTQGHMLFMLPPNQSKFENVGIHTFGQICMYVYASSSLFAFRMHFNFIIVGTSLCVVLGSNWLRLIDRQSLSVSLLSTPLLVSARSVPSIAAASRYDSDGRRYGQCR